MNAEILNTEILNEVALTYRNKYDITKRPRITTSQSSYELLLANWNKDTISLKEEFKILLLNRSNFALAISVISSGGTMGTVVDKKLIILTALKMNASGIIMAHNHPSGNNIPSESDKIITKEVEAAAKIIGIDILDHIIVCQHKYFSFADSGLI